jgi:hypothetical protein
MTRSLKLWVPLAVALVLLMAYSASAQRFDLTGVWRDDRGLTYSVRQAGDNVCWFQDSRPRVQRVFCGVLDRNILTGQWMDLPGGREMGDGQLTLRVETGSRIVRVRGGSAFDASTWTRDGGAPISSGPISSAPGPRSRPDNNNDWEMVRGTASDIGIGEDGTAWMIGTEATRGGFGIFRWTGTDWSGVDGGAIRIDVDGRGNPWIVNSDGYIFRRARNRWEQLPGGATDIGVGADGSAWVVGTNAAKGGYGIYRFNGNDWSPVDGGAVRIDVDARGNPWIVNSDGIIFRRARDRWEQLPGSARDISVTDDETAWIIGTEATQGGYSIYRWNGRDWSRVDGGGMQISVGGGRVWLVNSSGYVYNRSRR